MNYNRFLHNEAMALADGAYMAKRLGDVERARAMFTDAALLEMSVASNAPILRSRAILYRSAGWLAYHASEYHVARFCAEHGMTSARHDLTAQKDLTDLINAINGIHTITP